MQTEAQSDPSLAKVKVTTQAGALSRQLRRWVALPALLVALLCAPLAWSQSKADEYHVKAAFLFHFAQLVEWPDSAEDGSNNLMLCTLGDDPFHGELESTVEGKPVGSRILHIRHLSGTQSTKGCNVLFISRSEDRRLNGILTGLRNSPVLTVGEADDFLGSGGIIRFTLEGNKVRFEINREAAESARLKISAKLLLLAKNVGASSGGL